MELCYSTTNPKAPYRGQNMRAKKVAERKTFNRAIRSRKLLITWAQNATPIHAGFLAALLGYCKRERAELVVIPGRYKNPTSQWTEAQENAEWWDEKLTPYLYDGRKPLNSNVTLVGDVPIQPTATSPLTSFEGFTHVQSSIVGHPRLQLVTVATPQSRMPKLMTTTGAVTLKNYTDSRAGKLGDFHHVFGAALIEVAGDKVFHLRQINARKDGAFIDLERAYYPDGSSELCGPYLGVVFGDTHVRFRDRVVERGTFGKGGLVELLQPQKQIVHDVLDSYAGNPHHFGNPFVAIAKRRSGYDDFRGEVDEAIDWLEWVSKERMTYVVHSNHDDMLSRWISRNDWRTDPTNAEFYLETALHMAKATKMTETGTRVLDPFGYWISQRANPNVYPLARGESLVVGGSECSLHGHEGPNGARGSIKNLSKIGVKVISAHGHAPGIEGAHYRVGTSTPLHAEYTGAVGNWLNTHCSIDPFEKRHLHNIIGGRFRA